MATKPFMNTLPPVPDRVFLAALMQVVEYLFDDEYRDFVANPKPDHMLVNLVILLTWVRDQATEDGDRRLRRVK